MQKTSLIPYNHQTTLSSANLEVCNHNTVHASVYNIPHRNGDKIRRHYLVPVIIEAQVLTSSRTRSIYLRIPHNFRMLINNG